MTVHTTLRRAAVAMALTAAVTAAAQPVTPLWMRDARISPNGKEIAFTYRGDIFAVPVEGGHARRLTTATSYESAPVWSPDGTLIAFASDRNGGRDIFVMPAEGGAAKRLTTYTGSETPVAFTPDGTEVVYVAAIQDPASSMLFPTTRLTELYAVSTQGGRPRQVLATPADEIAWVPGTDSFVYMDIKGMEDKWRKHHTSSVTRDLWLYDAATGKHTNLTARPGEDRTPALSADGSTVTFLSERDGGSFNVYSFPLTNQAEVTQLTHFTDHPVRFLSQAADGTLAYTYDGELYRQRPGAQPERVEVSLTIDPVEKLRRQRFSSGADEVVMSPDGKQMAYTYRGDVFVSSVDHSSTKQITATAAPELNPAWSADGNTLYYTTRRHGPATIYKAERAHGSDPNFSNATTIRETPLFSDSISRERPLISPDGKKMLYLEDRNRLRVMDLATGAVKHLTEGETYPQRDGDFSMVWSPDSRWIALEMIDRRHDPYADIAILNVETGELLNLTNSGYFDLSPRWVLGGDAILYASERYGMRNHASWGSQYDVMIQFLNRDAYNKMRLSEEDYALLKEVEKSKKKAQADDKKDTKKGKKDAKKEPEAAPDTIRIDRRGLEERVMRLTPASADIADAMITDDGETLYYLAAFEDGYDLWKVALHEDDASVSLAKKLNQRRAGFEVLPDGTTFIVGPRINKLNTSSGSTTAVSYSGTLKYDPAAEREAMLDFVEEEEAERFYRTDMHGVDWHPLVAHYRRFLPHIDNNYDYADMVAELLGELNVSHTGARYRGVAPDESRAELGLLYDMAYPGPGLMVTEVLHKSPFDTDDTKMAPGAVITAVNGVTIEGDPYAPFLGPVGKKTLITFTLPGGEVCEEVVIPIDQYDVQDMLYDRWVRRNEAYVDSVSGGRLGYVHLQSMSDDSFRKAYSALLGRYNDREGVVIDTRWNGGGRLHEDIEILLSGEKYFTQVVRGVESCDMPSRRWNKPSVMVTAEANYSNAHGTPWVYQHQGLGKVVGAPVPGTMTSVNWVTLQDPTMYFGIPVVGYRLADGSYLENQQLEPDVLILNRPEDIVAGRDAQLDTAVSTLLNDIDGK